LKNFFCSLTILRILNSLINLISFKFVLSAATSSGCLLFTEKAVPSNPNGIQANKSTENHPDK
jgi:hypothetical protein